MNTPTALTEATILLRSANQPGKPAAEAIYCAGVTPEGTWVRLAPLSFHRGQSAKNMKRWDRVRFTAQKNSDGRPESVQVAPHSMAVVGECPAGERMKLLQGLRVKSLAAAAAEGRTLGLIQPKEAQFVVQRKMPAEYEAELAAHRALVEAGQAVAANKPYGYRFRYKYTGAEGAAEAVYEDNDMNATLDSLTKSYGEAQTISRIMQMYGKEYPKQGMMFVMERASLQAKDWTIAAVIALDALAAAAAAEEEWNVVC